MRNHWKRSVGLLVLGLALFTASCDGSGEKPLEPPVPEASRTFDIAPSLLGLSSTSFEGITLIRQPALPGIVRELRLIGPLGGTLSVDGHILKVPAGAVSEPAFFLIAALPSGYVEVELFAFTTAILGRITDIGSKGFLKPVELSLSYGRATNVTDPNRLFVLRVNSNGRHEPMPSQVDTVRKLVTAALDHFSRYCMASN